MAARGEDLIREFQRDRLRLIAYIRSLVGDLDLTEDIFQEVSVIVLQKADEYRSGADLGAWCRGIARNVILREREKTRRLRFFPDDTIVELVGTAFDENAPADLFDSHRGRLHECIGRLGTGQRELVSMRYASGLRLKEIAARLRRTEGAVQVALSRVRKALADCVASVVGQGGTA